MKRIPVIFLLIITLLFAGCAKKEANLNNLPDSYTTVISLPYSRFVGTDILNPHKDMGNITYNEEEKIYVSDKTILEFTPFYLVNDNNLIKIAGFQTLKEVDDKTVSYIRGIYNIMLSYYGDVKIDTSIKQRVNSINDIKQCKDGEFYKEVWNYEGFPVEYTVQFENGKALIRIQYNKEAVYK